MKKIMILGTSSLQIPALMKAKELGYFVIGIDKNEFSKGVPYCDLFYPISTMDKKAVLETAKKEKIFGIFTMATDRPMTTVAYVADQMSLVSNTVEAINFSTNKGLMRNRLKIANVEIPDYYIVSNFFDFVSSVNKIKGKCIIKASDNSGKRGIYQIKKKSNREELAYAYEYALSNSSDKKVLVEKLIYGPEVSVESITYKGETTIVAITDKINSGAPRFVELGHSQPSQLSESIIAKIKNLTVQAINALGICTGGAHTEIMVSNGKPYIIEVGPRLGGDYITSHLVPLSTSYDIVKEAIKVSMGEQPSAFSNKNNASAIRYFEVKSGKIKSIKGLNEARSRKGVVLVESFYDIGETIKEYKNSSDRFGCVISQAATVKEAIAICEKILTSVEVEVEGEI